MLPSSAAVRQDSSAEPAQAAAPGRARSLTRLRWSDGKARTKASVVFASTSGLRNSRFLAGQNCFSDASNEALVEAGTCARAAWPARSPIANPPAAPVRRRALHG